MKKFRSKNKKLFFIFVDLDKAFDRVPREVIYFALRLKGVPEYLVTGVMSLYKAGLEIRKKYCFVKKCPIMSNIHSWNPPFFWGGGGGGAIKF